MKIPRSKKQYLSVVLPALIAGLGIALVDPPQAPRVQDTPMSTQDRVSGAAWWPTKGSPSRGEYVGPEVCAECHGLKAETQKLTPMAHAATRALDSDILRTHSNLSVRSGLYEFEIVQTTNGSAYSVHNDTDSLSLPLAWAFGAGRVGQTYVFERDGVFYESRVSFYPKLQSLDLTLGHRSPPANDLGGALGRAMPASETRLCFGCHTTASTTSSGFDPIHLVAGVTCEACHGPGAKHVSAMRQNKTRLGLSAILNPARLSPVASVDFCGACHRTAWDVALANTTGVANVRFQPYRLEKSKCWGGGNARLTCTSCHDPHQQLVRDPSFYDSRCQFCHAPGTALRAERPGTKRDHRAAICPVGKSQCVACHMPKYEIPGSHAQFTDHWIRVVKADAPYPD